ncbi:MAG TPA: hypothetical protein VFK54_03625 [Candidatus Limnocylindrales bacterium]|nr:hypothetical protein [Candidatus Limnocylindrales bacterium]
MSEPRTIEGKAVISSLKPVGRRAIGPTIVAIEREAARPYAELLREADALLAEVERHEAWSARIREVRERIRTLLETE